MNLRKPDNQYRHVYVEGNFSLDEAKALHEIARVFERDHPCSKFSGVAVEIMAQIERLFPA